MNKRILLLMIVLAFSFGSLIDVFAGAYSGNEKVDWLVEKGIVAGRSETDLALDERITRAEIAKLLISLRDSQSNEGEQNTIKFTDVNPDDWFAVYVNTAIGRGFVKGYPDNTFLPGKAITVAEASAMILRASGNITETEISNAVWPKTYIDKARSLGILDGIEPSSAASPATREHVFEMVYNMKNLPDSSQFTYYDETKKFFISGDNLFIRKSPSDSAAVIGAIPINEIMTSTCENSDWACVDYNDMKGWVKSSYLKDYDIHAEGKFVLKVPYISQVSPVYAPVGCEGAAALMGLKYQGYAANVDLRQFLDRMPKHSSNPAKGYVGSPYTPDITKRTTIYPPIFAEYCNSYGPTADISGASPEDLQRELLNGNPVTVYATLYWENPRYVVYDIEGNMQLLLRNNHVITVAGYDPFTNSYYIADPYNKKIPDEEFFYWKDGETFERIYNERRHAVTFLKENKYEIVNDLVLNGENTDLPFKAVNIDSRVMVSISDIAVVLEAKKTEPGETEASITFCGKTLNFKINNNIYFANEQPETSDRAAVSIDGEMYVPIFVIAKEFGMTVGWDPENKSLEIVTAR